MISVFFALAMLVASSAGQAVIPVIVQIETKTVDMNDAGMTFGSVDIEIINRDFLPCKIYRLDGSGNDFQEGESNVFEVRLVN